MRNPSKDWGRTFFRSEIFSPGRPEALARGDEEAEFIARAMRLKKGARLLDLCCGTGRHSIPLAKRGLEVVGFDRTAEYLKEARWRGRKSRGLSFVRGDMRRIPFAGEFDAAINLWTSFGYFLDPKDDLRALKGVARALKPGGAFLIDIQNAAWLKGHFVPKSWHRRSDGAYVLEDTVQRTGKDPGCVSAWTVIKSGRKAGSASFFVRSYDDERLSRSLRAAGLRPVRRWGSLDGQPLSAETNRLVILAVKPG